MTLNIIAIETTDRQGSLAALVGEQLLAEVELPDGQRSAQSFAPALKSLWQRVGWRPRDVQLVAVASGPGSFTGLRVGVTAAKTLAYAVGSQLIAVDALEVIARQTAWLPGVQGMWAVIDAQRQQLFAARFMGGNRTLEIGQPTQIIDNAVWLEQLQPGELVAGPGLQKLLPQLPASVLVADRATWRPQAATVGCVGYAHFLAGRRDDPFQLAPQYLRKSAAEEQRGW